MPFTMQKVGAEKAAVARHMERYPMSSSDLLSSNSSSDADIRDLIYRNYQSNKSIERFGQMPTISNEYTRRPGNAANRPFSMITPKCTKIRTNPKYRYSYSNGPSKSGDPRQFDEHCENSGDNSSESQCSPVQRHSQRLRRRLKLRNQLR